MSDSRRLKIVLLIIMSGVGFGFGVWLFRAGFALLGCAFMALFLWRSQQFAIWLLAPGMAPSDFTPPVSSPGQRLLLSIICLLGAAVCIIGVYLWHLWPEEWQAGLVFILFGLMVLAPVTIWEIQNRRKQMNSLRGQ